ncbi:hypothetical protein [Agrobacterium tumefaciens]|uniref:hypothetical protein n=1 Tax=Agrobacterium tumefaciens TaxID=358 RepID=UPI001F1E9FCB
MGEFKKGDVIRAKRDINGFFDKGANYRIAKKIGQNFVLTDNDEPELEDAKHHTDLSWLIENFELVTLTIEAGKFYKTRAGRKVGPVRLKATHGSDGPYRIDGLWNYLENGLVGSISNGDHKDDLIAEWIDEPVAKASTTTASNDNAQPKFKVGDRVCAKHDSALGMISKGDLGTVKSVGGGHLRVTFDNGREDGWQVENFELVTPPTTFIVALIENGLSKPATSKRTALLLISSGSAWMSMASRTRSGWFKATSAASATARRWASSRHLRLSTCSNLNRAMPGACS